MDEFVFMDILTFIPTYISVQLGKWFSDFPLFLSRCSTTGHARELCGEGSKVNEFYSRTEFSASWRTSFWVVLFGISTWFFHLMPLFFCSALLNSLWFWMCPGETWMLTMTQWVSWHWYLEEAGGPQSLLRQVSSKLRGSKGCPALSGLPTCLITIQGFS